MSFFSSVGSFLGSDAGGNLLRTGATLASTAGNIYGANQASGAVQDAATESTNLQRDIYRQNRADLAPYRGAGYAALDAQAGLLGLGGGFQATEGFETARIGGESNKNLARLERLRALESGAPMGEVFNTRVGARNREDEIARLSNRLEGAQGIEQAPSPTESLRELPGYQFQIDEGEQAIGNRLAATGMSLSGKALKDLSRFRQGLADQTYGNQVNRLASLAGTGQTATTNTASMGSNFGQQAGQNMMAAGDVRASSYLTGARQAGQGLNNLAYIWGQ